MLNSKVSAIGMRSSIIELLDIFADSGKERVEVVRFTHKNAESCAKSIKNAIKNYRANTIRCEYKAGHVYLIKVSI